MLMPILGELPREQAPLIMYICMYHVFYGFSIKDGRAILTELLWLRPGPPRPPC